MRTNNRKIGDRPDSGVLSLGEINARVADARRVQSRAIARLVSSYFGAFERHARSRPRLID